MTITHFLTAAAALATAAAAPALAQGAPAAKTGATPAAAMKPAKPMAAKPMAAKPMAAKPMAMSSAAHPMKPAAHGRMVTTKTASGKKITYDCTKPGNAAKQACKA